MSRLLPSLFLAAAAVLSGSYSVHAQAPAIAWDRTSGDNRQDLLSASQPTSDGGYILAGSSSSDISGDKTQATQGVDDYWIIKLDATGSKQWDRTFGGSSFDLLSALQQTRDGGYVLGGSSDSGIGGDKGQANQGFSDYWVVKLAADPLASTPATSHSLFSAYPNPTRRQLTLSGPLGTPYQLLTPLGQVVRSGQVSPQPLDVQTLPAGLYLLRDQATGRTTQLVKE